MFEIILLLGIPHISFIICREICFILLYCFDKGQEGNGVMRLGF